MSDDDSESDADRDGAATGPLTPIAPDLWAIDGAPMRVAGLPLPARAALARLSDGGLWLHAPVAATPDLVTAVAGLGDLAHIVVPGPAHLPNVAGWCTAFPDAQVTAPRGLIAELPGATVLEGDTSPWPGLRLKHLPGRRGLGEVVILHEASESLILHRLIMNIDTAHIPPWVRPAVWLAGIDTTDGKMPPGLARRLGGRVRVADAVDEIIAWHPRRILPTHGRIYPRSAADELERAFRRLLRTRRWDKALSEAKRREAEEKARYEGKGT